MAEKKVVVITGAGTGLGEALVKRFAESDYHVCLLGRRESALREVVAKYQCRRHPFIRWMYRSGAM